MQETHTFVRKASIHAILENVEMLSFPLNILYLYFRFFFTFTFLYFVKKESSRCPTRTVCFGTL